MANIKYKLCPECELNWIPEEEDICDICHQIHKGEIDLCDDIEDEDLMLCPKCNVNYILESEDLCESCLAKKKIPEGEEENEDYDITSDVTIVDEDEDVVVSFDEIEEEEEEFAKDEDVYDDIDDDEQDY